jgi:hypothetical protein
LISGNAARSNEEGGKPLKHASDAERYGAYQGGRSNGQEGCGIGLALIESGPPQEQRNHDQPTTHTERAGEETAD